jgi:hypothetical protein
MIELRAFYELLSILPSELGQAVVKGLEGLLRRPRRRFDSGLGPKGLSWVLIILENPLLFRNGSDPSQAAGSVIKRFLGLVSNLANDQHHYVSLRGHRNIHLSIADLIVPICSSCTGSAACTLSKSSSVGSS